MEITAIICLDWNEEQGLRDFEIVKEKIRERETQLWTIIQ